MAILHLPFGHFLASLVVAGAVVGGGGAVVVSAGLAAVTVVLVVLAAGSAVGLFGAVAVAGGALGGGAFCAGLAGVLVTTFLGDEARDEVPVLVTAVKIKSSTTPSNSRVTTP